MKQADDFKKEFTPWYFMKIYRKYDNCMSQNDKKYSKSS